MGMELLAIAQSSLLGSKLQYCAAGWQPWLAPSNVKVLERAQNVCLRKITGLLQTAPIDALRAESGVCSVKTKRKRSSALAIEKSRRLGILNPRRVLLEKCVPHHLKGKSSLRLMGEGTLRDIGLGNMSRLEFPVVPMCPWRNVCQSVKTHKSLVGGSTKASPRDQCLNDTILTLHERGQFDFTVFTDGSVEEGVGQGGSAMVACTGAPGEYNEVAVRRRRGVCTLHRLRQRWWQSNWR
jgi:hypothetical protein